MPEKKQNKFLSFIKFIFVHNWDLKLGAIVLGFVTWLMVALAI